MNRSTIVAITAISALGMAGLTSCDVKSSKETKTTETKPAVPPTERYFAVMKQSIENGELSDTSWEEVLKCKVTGEEDRKGHSFWTGSVVFEQSSAMGSSRVSAKAWMRDDRVVHWEILES